MRIATKAVRIAEAAVVIFAVDVAAAVVVAVRIEEEEEAVVGAAVIAVMAASCLSRNTPRTVRTKFLLPNPHHRRTVTSRRFFPANH
jgi:hypothetical protein